MGHLPARNPKSLEELIRAFQRIRSGGMLDDKTLTLGEDGRYAVLADPAGPITSGDDGLSVAVDGTSIEINDDNKLAAVAKLTTKGDLLTFTTALARLGVGSNGAVLTADSTAAAGIAWTPPPGRQYIRVVEKQAYSTHAGNYPTANTWQKRLLNTLEVDDTGSSAINLANNRFTLPAGKWYCRFVTTARGIGQGGARLIDYAASSELTIASFNLTDATACIPVIGSVTFTLASASGGMALEIYGNTAQSADTAALGVAHAIATSSGTPNRYSVVECWKVG
jgi:hypothetical protein